MCKIHVIDWRRNHLGWFYGFVLGLCLLTPIPGWAVHLQEHLDEWNPLRSHLDARGMSLETVNTTDIGSNVNSEGSTKALIIGDID